MIDRPNDDLPNAVAQLFALDQELLNDPFPIYERMRAGQPMRVAAMVAISRYEDVKSVLRDPETFTSVRFGSREQARLAELPPSAKDKFAYLTDFEGAQMVQTSDPEHARIRRFVNATFSAKGI